MSIPPSQHASPWWTSEPRQRHARGWKIVLVLVALAGFLIWQSGVVNWQAVGRAITHSPEPTRSTAAPKRKHAPVPTPLPASYKEAAVKAQQYVDSMHLSEEGIRDQLTGKRDHYSQWAAQYAIEHVTADYPANALIIAKDLQGQGVQDPEAMMKRLTSSKYKFTPADAEYALRQLYPPQIVDSVLSEEQ
ncbi:Ltp family lipoprotein [Bifidobacterium xylocopae]|uniref:Putative host cell surface-exposed lipoprotein Ltp-like HTH region domain-containing protein n=1 Tax=Bifidobacterium xylocopae TaxID=2493119 RepID=A0A366KE32_9BIFI|nr:Ltp family lipoprotein [Bifidobacterium xylocopae]RBP99985.1 hypothetical protein CRD59_00515 [Bifidobacterium xylocopae]